MNRFKQKVATLETPQTETPSFKAWFGNSKISEDGMPVVVYHVTKEPMREIFKLSF